MHRSWKPSHFLFSGMSSKFPITGSGAGPGGRGLPLRRFLQLITDHIYVSRSKVVTAATTTTTTLEIESRAVEAYMMGRRGVARIDANQKNIRWILTGQTSVHDADCHNLERLGKHSKGT